MVYQKGAWEEAEREEIAEETEEDVLTDSNLDPLTLETWLAISLPDHRRSHPRRTATQRGFFDQRFSEIHARLFLTIDYCPS